LIQAIYSLNQDASRLDMTSMDALLLKEAEKHGMLVEERDGTRRL
jgi:hypothetical protein